MIVQSLINEFNYEAESTRRLLSAIPDSALDFKVTNHELSWTTAQLASHIVNIYSWYEPTLHQPSLDMANFGFVPYDIDNMKSILTRFEENVVKARAAVERTTEEILAQSWSMTVGERVVIPPTPKVAVMRSFLMNHLYHHRGEMIVYLRSSGNIVPGLYGPTREEMAGRHGK